MNELGDTGSDEGLPSDTLSAGEDELVQELASQGIRIAGLALGLDPEGRSIVEQFAPDKATQVPDGHRDATQPQALTLDELGQIGIERFEREQYGSALAAFRLEWRLRLMWQGAEHADALIAANNLAEMLRIQGDVAGALEIQESVYGVRHRLLGPEHTDTLLSARNLAEKLSTLGHLSRARNMQEMVLEAVQRRLGPEHAETLTSACQLAATLSAQGHLADVRRIEENVYQIRRRLLGPQDPSTLSAAHNLAHTLVSLGDLASARALQDSVHETCQQLFGSEHPHTLSSANNLAQTMSYQGDAVGARRMHESTYEIRRRVLGADHPETLTSANNLASSLWSVGDLVGARKLEQWVYETRTRVLGPEHPDTLTVANNLSLTLRDLKDLAGARKIQESVYELRRRVLGPDHLETLTSASNLSTILRAEGNLAGARLIQQEVYEKRNRISGPQHPGTLTSLHNLVVTLYELKDLAACGALSCQLLQTLCAAGVATDVAFRLAGNMPMLRSPMLPWPAVTIDSMRQQLPIFSRLLTQRLELLPQESWDAPYDHYQRLHRRWQVFASGHAPEQMLSALGGLHGIRSFSQVQADLSDIKLAALADDGERSLAAAEYVQARQSLNILRELIADVVARTPGDDGLAGLRIDERDATQRRERAEARLARLAPDLAAAVGALRMPRGDELAASLAPTDAWLAFLPGEPAFAYLLRPQDEPSWLKLGDLNALGRAFNTYMGAMRTAHRGLMRDNERVGDSPIPAVSEPPHPSPALNLSELRQQVRQSFWQPLTSALLGVQRLHLVTGAGFHDLLLEFALPPELASLQVLRYCGLPAYQRSLLPDMQDALPPPRSQGLSVASDDGWRSTAPIPFTSLDALLPERAGLVRRLTDAEIGVLAGEQPVASSQSSHRPLGSTIRLMLSTHGMTVGRGDRRGGQVLLPAGADAKPRWLKPQALAAQGLGVRWLFSLSCWGAHVGDSGQGDAYGAMSTLQLAGLRSAIGCLAPVADFCSPLISALIWHGLLQGEDLATALQQAIRRLRDGPLADMPSVLQPLRQGYRQLMLEILKQARPGTADSPLDSTTRQHLLRCVMGWSLPGIWRRRLGVDADLAWWARTLPATPDAQAQFVDACLDVLLRDPADRDRGDCDEDGPVVEAIDHLCAVTVVFGRG